MPDISSPAQVQQAATNQSDHSAYELKMLWVFRWCIFGVYALVLILSIAAAVLVAIATRSLIPGVIPASPLLAMKPIVKWAFTRPTS